jgi:hypothetical protein
VPIEQNDHWLASRRCLSVKSMALILQERDAEHEALQAFKEAHSAAAAESRHAPASPPSRRPVTACSKEVERFSWSESLAPSTSATRYTTK